MGALPPSIAVCPLGVPWPGMVTAGRSVRWQEGGEPCGVSHVGDGGTAGAASQWEDGDAADGGGDARKPAETGPALHDRLWSAPVRPDPAPLGFVVNRASVLSHTGDMDMRNSRMGRDTSVVPARLSIVAGKAGKTSFAFRRCTLLSHRPQAVSWRQSVALVPARTRQDRAAGSCSPVRMDGQTDRQVRQAGRTERGESQGDNRTGWLGSMAETRDWTAAWPVDQTHKVTDGRRDGWE